MMASCADDATMPARGGEGTITIDCNKTNTIIPALGVITRASGDDVTELADIGCTVPAEQRVLVTSLTEGIEYNEVFASPSSFNNIDYNPRLEAGEYMVTIGSAKPLYDWKTPSGDDVTAKEAPTHPQRDELIPQCPEGENLPYLFGKKIVTVEAGDHDKPVVVTMAVINTAVCIEFSDAFRKYFADGATIDLTTKAGNTFTVSYTANERIKRKYFWIRPEEFKVAGTALRQSPSPGIVEATPVTIKEYTIGHVATRTLYTVRFDVENVGGNGLSIEINGTPIETLEQEVELNPNAFDNLIK